MDIKPYSQQLAQSASNSRALATLSSADGGQGGGWEELVNLSSQRLTSKAQQTLTYEHLAKNSKLPPALDLSSDKGGMMQQLVDKALGFDRKKFNEIEGKLKEIADNKQLSAEEREQQSKALNEQKETMLQDAMDRLTGKKSAPKEETRRA
ncbi:MULTISPECIES: hypothetical protein [unclassified Aeromonas]|jgi:hypothetical protein|uniref:hypothetical protein n=1 Tax=unclassified Aeromonas TaxID=257493 RepID=UPI000D395A4F|nr:MULTISPECIES: hypothetical protein [unclassified Aeromonas]PTT55212.1 hypothetical protein DBR19_03355 [Aeromonas sp. HMWF014]